MKILIIQENGRNVENRYMRECFSLCDGLRYHGADAKVWGLGHDNYDQAFEDVVADRDVVVCLENYDSGWLPDLSTVRVLKVFWSIDAHCALRSHVELCRRAAIDLLLSSTEGYLPAFSNVARNVCWFPNAVDSQHVRRLPDVAKSYDVGFCGSVNKDREKWLGFLSERFALKRDIFVLGEDMVRAINSYRISFNKSLADDINYRVFETLACGTLLLTNYSPGMEKIFDIDRELVVYRNREELLDHVAYYVDNEPEREEIAECGRQRVLKDHTYRVRSGQLMELLQAA